MNWIYSTKFLALLMAFIVSVQVRGQNPNWVAPTPADFNSTATAVTTIALNGLLSNNPGDQIAIFSGSELRGLSTAVDIGGQNYQHFITVYSNTSAEVMSIQVYHQATDLVYDVVTPLEFEAQQIFGSVNAPLEVNIYDANDAPIFLNVVPAQVTLEGLPFSEIDLLDYLIQPDNQGIIWSFTPNSDLIVSFTGSLLQVEGANGFTGTTTLTIRATETPLGNSKQGGPGHHTKALSGPQFAERNISFNVTPAYAAPRWTTIPGEAILIGDQFTPVNLHDFEDQYAGPAIKYDYRPIIVESTPADQVPSWTFSGNFATSMSVIATVNYTPKYQFDHPDDILAAFVGNSIRGVATRDADSGLYFLHISGSIAEIADVTIRFYSGVMKKEFVLDSEFDFQSNQIVGSIQNPYALEFAPIVPVVSDDPIAGGIYVMPVNVVDESYIGTEFFDFYASDPDYPETLSDTTLTSFCIFPLGSDLPLLFADNDGDGFGDPNNAIAVCGAEVPGYVDNDFDCDDTSPVDPAIMIAITETSAIVANDGFICADDNVTLTAVGGTAYEWSTGATTPAITIMPSAASIYRVTATRSNLGIPCKGVAIVSIGVEGNVVTTSANDGHGSLRSVIDCLIGGDTLTFDQPVIAFSDLTAPIIIDKEVSILGQSMTMRPQIKVDFTSMNTGFEVLSGQRLNIIDTDFSVINGGVQPIISGPGSVFIQGRTDITEE